jgi:mono/diheme cytochrome c family protein
MRRHPSSATTLSHHRAASLTLAALVLCTAGCTGVLSVVAPTGDGGAPPFADGGVDRPRYDAGRPPADPADPVDPVDPADADVVLPIEVLASGGSVETSVTVEASDVSSVDRIWLAAYSAAHPDQLVADAPERYRTPKAELRLNDGPWIGLTNETVTCNAPDARLGCLGGPLATVRFAVSTDLLGEPRPGENTLRFRFNYAPTDVSSGYYVIGLAFLNAGDAPPSYEDWRTSGAIDGTVFAYDDPAAWEPPEGYATPDAIRVGAELWAQRDLLADYPGGPPIEASCADCHARDGIDLELFSFSNASIATRARFHGLSEDEALSIAAYIRSLGGRHLSWPWQPPYQPGPTISSPDPDCDGRHPDEADPICWVAGGGLEAVLDEDRDMRPFLFPGGMRGEAGQAVAGTRNDINLREIPIDLQYPDWNEWLPRVHPLDATAWSDSDFTRSEVWRRYEDGSLEEAWVAAERDRSRARAAASAMTRWYGANYQFRRNHIDKRDDPPLEVLGYAQWKAVKTWEVMLGREGFAPDVYEHGEARSWVGADRTVFDVAPHIHKGRIYGDEHSAADSYLDTAWYDLQMVLNAGNRSGEHPIRPMDWKYHLQHVRGMEHSQGIFQAYRYARSYIKQVQMLDTGDGSSDLHTWHWRHTTHGWLTSKRGPTGRRSAFDQLPDGERSALLNALFQSYLDRILRVPPDAWPRGSDNQTLTPEDRVPQPSGRIRDTDFEQHFYVVLPWLEELGVSASLLDRAYRWAATMWPRGNDRSAMGSNPTWDDLNPCMGGERATECD